MDLSWCIICDNRIEDDVADSALYCSELCKSKDQSSSQLVNPSLTQSKPLRSKLPLRSKQQRPTAPSTVYPWVPLYRRRHGTPLSRRCPPTTASLTVTARGQTSRDPLQLATVF